MELRYVFVWVTDVRQETAFFEHALGLAVNVLEEAPGHGWRAELDTGTTTLYLADESELGQPGEIPADAYRNTRDAAPAAFQITFAADDVDRAYSDAISAGGTSIAQPYRAPWGQTLARLRTPGGVVVSLASPFPPPQA